MPRARPLWPFWLAGALAGGGPGDPRCPCILDAAALAPVTPEEWRAFDASLDNRSYGVGCGAHDTAREACRPSTATACDGSVQPPPAICAGDGLGWCKDNWCYVDHGSCSISKTHSVGFPSSGRYYSYATCGNLDASKSSHRTLKGRTLLVGVQSNTGGWQGSYHPTQRPHVRDDRWTGPLWELVMRTAEAEQMIINITEPPAIVKRAANHSSSFWHCTYGPGMGFLDLCVGMHTVTATRMRMTPWFIVQLNSLYLVTRSKKPGFWDLVQNTFRPFKYEMWFIMVVVVLFVSGVVTLQERATKHGPQDWSEERSPGPREHYGENVVSGLRALYDCGVGHSACMPAQVTQLGLGFFILLLVTGYTANLTTFLVVSQQQGAIKDWEDARSRGVSVCGTRLGSLTARLLYPTVNWIRDPEDGEEGVLKQSNVLEYMAQGICDVAVMDHQDLHVAHSEGKHCESMRVGEPIAFETVGMPLNSVGSLAKELSQAFTRQMELGTWETIKMKYYKPSQCEPSEAEEGVQRLGPSDFVGAFFLLLAFLASGVTLSAAQRWDLATLGFACAFCLPKTERTRGI